MLCIPRPCTIGNVGTPFGGVSTLRMKPFRRQMTCSRKPLPTRNPKCQAKASPRLPSVKRCSIKRLKKDELNSSKRTTIVPRSAASETTRTAPPVGPTKEEIRQDYESYFINLGTFGVIAFFGLGYILYQLPEMVPTDQSVGGWWKFGLILSHIFPFVLAPVGMRVFFQALPSLEVRPRSVFASQLALGFLMVAIASETGWHVTQHWFYQNDFTMLNFMFYFFLTSATALWADGLVKEDTKVTRLINACFALGLVAACVAYTTGAALSDDSYKAVIYVVLTLATATLTYRGYQILDDWRVIFYPVLSVGVNLYFISLLSTYGKEDPSLNALFHIAHDVFGTEAGVAWFVYLFYLQIPRKELRA
eukprot:g6178.t1